MSSRGESAHPSAVDAARRHSRFSDPGPHAGLLRDLPGDVESLAAAARNVIVHYRAQLRDFPPERVPEVNSRWVREILRRDQERFAAPLDSPRPMEQRVAGCCRDHSLFLTAALRERGVPARNRVGFANYLSPGWRIDHVITEYHDGTRWVRTDAEFATGDVDFDPRDMGTGVDSPEQSAAEAWLAYRAGSLDLRRHAVFPGAEGDLAGPALVRRYVPMQLAHRCGDEMLLWDGWGAPLTDAEIDRVARLLVAADAGDAAAEDELTAWYRDDERLHPGTVVQQFRLDGSGSDPVDLASAR